MDSTHKSHVREHDDMQAQTDALISHNVKASRVRSPKGFPTNVDEIGINIEDDEDDSKQTSPLLKGTRADVFNGNTLFYTSSQKVFNEALRFQISGLIGSIMFLILRRRYPSVIARAVPLSVS